MSRQFDVYTIGHSTHPIEAFVDLLLQYSIDTVIDVRSAPYSKWQPQYNREELAGTLASSNIKYVYLGKELGARTDDPGCYTDGQVRYALLAKTPLFASG